MTVNPRLRAYACVVCILSTLVSAQSDIMNKHQFHASLDEDSKFLLHWSFDNALQIMTFTVEVKTTGWIGFGISPYTGKMPGSDVVIGWVDSNGKAYLQDRFAKSRSLPTMDDQQDYNLISSNEVNGTTTLTFSRKWDTKDKNDLLLDTGTTRLIWSYHKQDPSSPNEIPMHQKMGARSLNLFERMPDEHKSKLPADTQTYDFLAPNVTVPSVETTYWCVGMKLPQVTKKHHIIQVNPVLIKGNEGVVHHMTLYECESDLKWHGYSSECSSKNMPNHLYRCRGGSAIVGWAVGGETITFPVHAGFPLGSESSPKFAILEIHYDNPDEKSGIIDSSGFRLYYTKQLREHDIGVFTIGHYITPTMMIPEKQTRWNITGYCPEHCTERGIPKDGIDIFSTYMHTHLTGIALNIRHFRKGIELPMMAENKHYDFNYQEVLYLKDEVKLLPGDSLALTCTYKTTDRDRMTVGGFDVADEMCVNYVFYYPKMPFAVCVSYISYEDVSDYLSNLTKAGIMPLSPTNDPAGLKTALKNTTIGDQKLIDQLNELLTYTTPQMFCSNYDYSLVMEKRPMKIPNFKSVANYTATPNNKAITNCSASSIITLLYAVAVVLILY